MDLDGPLAPVWSRGHISVADLWSYYRQYPYLITLRDRKVLDEAVRSVLNEITWEAEGFALAEGYDETTGRYLGLAIPHENTFGEITDHTLLVLPSLARQQQSAEQPPSPAGLDNGSGYASVAGIEGVPPTRTNDTRAVTASVGGAAPSSGPPTKPENVRFFGVVRLNPERYGRELTRLSQEILQHLAAVEGTQLDVRVEISAVNPDGFPTDKVRIVTENASTLKFETFGFEND